MKRHGYLPFLLILSITLGACAGAASKPTDDVINPGDKIGDFLITTGGPDDVTYTWDLDCTKQGEGEIYSCKANVGTKVNVSVGIYDDTFMGKLENVWAGHTYELFIEDRPVNLPAFGFIDVRQPQVGTMRHWNVVVITDKPGAIKLHDSGVVNGDPFKSTMTYIFNSQ